MSLLSEEEKKWLVNFLERELRTARYMDEDDYEADPHPEECYDYEYYNFLEVLISKIKKME